MGQERVVILYDDDCGFCRWSLARILAWDHGRRLRPVALRDSEAGRLLPGFSAEERAASWHLVTADGRVFSGGAAVAPLARMLPAGVPIAWLAEALPGNTRRLYRLIARNRGRLGRLVGARVCVVGPLSRPTGRSRRRRSPPPPERAEPCHARAGAVRPGAPR